jgi:hypothetical protein
VSTLGYTIVPIHWNAEDSGGSKLDPGFYFYKIKVGNDLGYQTERIQKMVISN